MKSRKIPLLCLLAASLSTYAQTAPNLISTDDAKGSIELVPNVEVSRRRGAEIALQLQENRAYDQDRFFVFYVYDLKAASYSSPTIGYFAVNKHTADVLQVVPEPKTVKSPRLSKLQVDLRRRYHIDTQTIAKYRSENVYAGVISPEK